MDVDNEFDDEDTFLNLDDVLEGALHLQCLIAPAACPSSSPALALCRH